MQTFTVWLLLLVTNATDEVAIVRAYPTEHACEVAQVKEEHKAPPTHRTHYECVEATVERDTEHPWKEIP